MGLLDFGELHRVTLFVDYHATLEVAHCFVSMVHKSCCSIFVLWNRNRVLGKNRHREETLYVVTNFSLF